MNVTARRHVTADGRAYEIRSARVTEAGALLDHLVDTRATVDSLRTLIAQLAAAPGGVLLVAVADGVVGSLVIATDGELALSVRASWRRQGVARALLDEGVAHVSEGVWLDVAPGNVAARRLYASVGFRDCGAGAAGLLRLRR